jgi:hypothetical protein
MIYNLEYMEYNIRSCHNFGTYYILILRKKERRVGVGRRERLSLFI